MCSDIVLLNDKFVTNNKYHLSYRFPQSGKYPWMAALFDSSDSSKPRWKGCKGTHLVFLFFWPLSSYLSKLSETIQIIGFPSFSSFWPLFSEDCGGTLLVPI